MRLCSVLLVLICISCTNSPSKEFTITCQLASDGYDHRYAYMSILDDSLTHFINLDSVKIKNNEIAFKRKVPQEEKGHYIFIGTKGINRIEHPLLLFIPEEGDIKMLLNNNFYPTLSGTAKNVRLQEALSLKPELDSLLELYIKNSILLLSEKKEIPQESSELVNLEKKYSVLIYNYLNEIKGSPLYDDIFLKYGNSLKGTSKEKELTNHSGKRYKNRLARYNNIINKRHKHE